MLIWFHSIAHKLYKMNVPLLPKLIYYCQYLLFNSSVPPSVIIGKNTKFAYGGIGVVIHSETVIGENCILGQGITIGGKSKHKRVPIIGNNVYLSAGCRILGPISIGDNSIVGANSVVIKHVPSNCIVAGVPSKILKTNINPRDYY